MPAEFPHMNEMLKDFMQRRSAVHAAGLAAIDRGEVEPYDAVPAQVLDPKQAWDEATAALAHFGMHEAIAAPADWPQLVATADAAIALPFAAGHFPQSVRDLQRLARAVPPAVDGATRRPTGGPNRCPSRRRTVSGRRGGVPGGAETNFPNGKRGKGLWRE